MKPCEACNGGMPFHHHSNDCKVCGGLGMIADGTADEHAESPELQTLKARVADELAVNVSHDPI
jgi:hypothetical protein